MTYAGALFAACFTIISGNALFAADTTRPTLSVLSPTSGQRVANTSSDVIVKGKARDNVHVSSVQVQLNGGVWLPAATTNGYTNWTATIAPQAATNRVRAYATDSSGNFSATNNLTFDFVVPSTLLLITNGLGGISRSFEGLELEVGRNYTVRAVPDAGQIFAGWDGSLVTTEPVLHFTMIANMNLDAHFVPNPFPQALGRYNGLFAEPVRAHDHSGFFSLVLGTKGGYSASLKRGTNVYSFSGKFNAAGLANTNVSGMIVSMALDLATGETITGSVSTGTWAANLLANRAAFNSLTNPASQFQGKYTLIIPGGADASVSPAGHGYGALTVGPSGYVTLNGGSADGRSLFQNVGLSRNGDWAVYIPLYGGQGSISGWLEFDTNQPITQINGSLSCIRPPISGATYYPLGFTNDAAALGSRYTAPGDALTRSINVTNGVVVFAGGNLSTTFTNSVRLTRTNTVINHSSNSLTISINRTNGLFSGSVTVPGSGSSTAIRGALLQDMDAGFGYFLGTDQSGSVFFGQP